MKSIDYTPPHPHGAHHNDINIRGPLLPKTSVATAVATVFALLTSPGVVAADDHALPTAPEIEVGHVGEMFSEVQTFPTILNVSATSTTAEQTEPTRTISSTEDWNRIWNSVLAQEEVVVVDNSLTVEAILKDSTPPTATHFTLTGKGLPEGPVTISTNTPAGSGSSYYSLINLGVKTGTSITINNIDFKSKLENNEEKSGFAIYINNRSTYKNPKIDTLNLTNLSFSGFNDQYVIGVDADKSSPNQIEEIVNFKIENIEFENNSITKRVSSKVASLLYSGSGKIDNLEIHEINVKNNATDDYLFWLEGIKNADVDNLCVTGNTIESGGVFFAGSANDSSMTIKNVYFQDNNTSESSSLILQKFQTLSLTNSTFKENSSGANGGALTLTADEAGQVGSDPNDGTPWVETVLFEGNTANDNGGAVYSATNVHFVDTTFQNNTADAGGAVYFGDQKTSDIKATFTNVEMLGNDAGSGKGSAIYAELYRNWDETTGNKGISIVVEAIGKHITWTGSDDDNQTTIAFNFRDAQIGNYFNLGLYSKKSEEQPNESEASLQISGGLSVNSSTENTDNVSNISIGGSTEGDTFETSNVKLGGKSTFSNATVNFDVKAGRFELLSDADLNWEDGAAGRLRTAAGSEFALSLNEIDPTDVNSHGGKAKIHLAGNTLDLEQGSSLSVDWNERLEALPAVGSHWLILAEDAKLTETSAPDVSVNTDNWILDYAMKVSDGTQLTQGIVNEDGTVAEGTEKNVYIGFSTESTEDPDPIDPDEDIRSATNLTAHFAYSSIREVSRGMLHWRPVRSDAFWSIPQYLHDRRDRDDFGVGFDAQLRGITVGKDFTTDNGFWGAAFGYGDGNIHSLGGIAYTSGDVQSWWAGIYGQHNVNDWRFEGILSYLCQDADQDQSNSAADLHLNTKNDVVLVSGKVARNFVLDKNAERTIRMTPSVGLEYVWLKQRDFNVRMNSGETLLKGEAEDMNVFSVPVDLRFDRDWAGDNGWRHNAGVTLGGSFNFGDDTMSGDFTGPNGVAADGWRLIPLDDYQGRVAAEYVLLHPNQAFSISAGAGYTFSKSRELLDLQAVIRYTW